ncbi:trypsin [Dongia mobilis]|uniref:Trypsin n=1 Tax=Dongia mobilis TaxID=578943 RepID=A0A4R6WUF2_9PROT|nr:trypsin-like serine protease [Dongia mobilis]TDQ83449.1 trypsin [Dongia mobilis]
MAPDRNPLPGDQAGLGPFLRRSGFGFVLLAALAACATPVRMVDRPSGPLPWSAAIGRMDSEAAGGSCSATLVQPDVILTASHCLYGQGDNVRIIDFAFTPALDAGRERIRPVKVASLIAMGWPIQPEKGWEENEPPRLDWALLRLTQRIDFVSPLPVEKLSVAEIDKRLDAGATLSHAGYGVYGLGSGKRLQVRDNCRLLDDRRVGGDVIKNSCPVIQGDSGGPILLTEPDGTRKVVGIITNFWRSESGDQQASFGPSSVNFAAELPASGGALPTAASDSQISP